MPKKGDTWKFLAQEKRSRSSLAELPAAPGASCCREEEEEEVPGEAAEAPLAALLLLPLLLLLAELPLDPLAAAAAAAAAELPLPLLLLLLPANLCASSSKSIGATPPCCARVLWPAELRGRGTWMKALLLLALLALLLLLALLRRPCCRALREGILASLEAPTPVAPGCRA
jgi:hypothetical protein